MRAKKVVPNRPANPDIGTPNEESLKPVQSAAMKEYIRCRLELELQVSSGKITASDFMNGDMAARTVALPGLTPDEVVTMAEDTGDNLYALEKEIAARGLPSAPGNNPLKPN